MTLTASKPHAEAHGIDGLTELKDELVGPSGWREVTQEMIDTFAELSGDDQWIHVDVERAARESPFGTTIAHGNLTLSLIDGLRRDLTTFSGFKLGRQLRLEQGPLPGPGPGRHARALLRADRRDLRGRRRLAPGRDALHGRGRRRREAGLRGRQRRARAARRRRLGRGVPRAQPGQLGRARTGTRALAGLRGRAFSRGPELPEPRRALRPAAARRHRGAARGAPAVPHRHRHGLARAPRGAHERPRLLAARDRTCALAGERDRRRGRVRGGRPLRRPSGRSGAGASTSSTPASARSAGCRTSSAGRSVVDELLAPGGRLFIREGHPMLWALQDAREDRLLVVEHAYFEREEPLVYNDDGTYVPTDATFEHNTTHEWNHGLGEIVSALLAARSAGDGTGRARQRPLGGLPRPDGRAGDGGVQAVGPSLAAGPQLHAAGASRGAPERGYAGPLGRERYDALVLGAGHNGLVAAAYLARAGRSVAVLERAERPGGAAVSVEALRRRAGARLALRVSRQPAPAADRRRAAPAAAARPPQPVLLYARPARGRAAWATARPRRPGRDRGVRARLAGTRRVRSLARAAERTRRARAGAVPDAHRAAALARALRRALADEPLWEALFERPLGELLEVIARRRAARRGRCSPTR